AAKESMGVRASSWGPPSKASCTLLHDRVRLFDRVIRRIRRSEIDLSDMREPIRVTRSAAITREAECFRGALISIRGGSACWHRGNTPESLLHGDHGLSPGENALVG